MKIIQSIPVLCLALLALTACESDLDKVTYNESTVKTATLKSLESGYTLEAKKEGETAITFSWTRPDVGYQAEITTDLQMALKGRKFTQATTLSSTKTGLNHAITVKELNNKIIAMLEANNLELAPADFEFRLVSRISEAKAPFYSNVVSTRITPYSTEREYPKVWIIGDYCGWNHGNSQFLFSFAENEIYQGIIDFGGKAANGFKITGAAGWDASHNWGTNGSAPAPEAEAGSIQLLASGGSGNIGAYSQRFYHFTFNNATLLFKKDFSFNQLGIVGSGVGSWDVDVVMKFDAAKQRFYVDKTLVEGEIKFRANGAWTSNWGGSNGTLTSGGDNIKVKAGNYRVYVNLNNAGSMTYELSTKDYGK